MLDLVTDADLVSYAQKHPIEATTGTIQLMGLSPWILPISQLLGFLPQNIIEQTGEEVKSYWRFFLKPVDELMTSGNSDYEKARLSLMNQIVAAGSEIITLTAKRQYHLDTAASWHNHAQEAKRGRGEYSEEDIPRLEADEAKERQLAADIEYAITDLSAYLTRRKEDLVALDAANSPDALRATMEEKHNKALERLKWELALIFGILFAATLIYAGDSIIDLVSNGLKGFGFIIPPMG